MIGNVTDGEAGDVEYYFDGLLDRWRSDIRLFAGLSPRIGILSMDITFGQIFESMKEFQRQQFEKSGFTVYAPNRSGI